MFHGYPCDGQHSPTVQEQGTNAHGNDPSLPMLCVEARTNVGESKLPNAARYDGNAAFQTANACFELAGSVFSRVPDDVNEAAKFTYENLGEIFAAATNLALAIELYLKSLAIATGSPVLRTHNLLELFDTLPKVLRDSIELRFRDRMSWLGEQERSIALTMAITSTPSPPPMDSVPVPVPDPDSLDLRGVLNVEKDPFKTWRYIHETGPELPVLYSLEYGRLGVIANALQDHFGTKPR